MTKKNFLLLSLEDSETKKIANIVGNDSCRKILDFLSGKDATESELAKELDLPLSTVHYNLQQLVKAELVAVEEFHYSEKGKEVNHYTLANKYIIISPKKVFGIKQKLKSILPAGLVALGAAFVIQFAHRFTGIKTSLQGMPDAPAAAEGAAALREAPQALDAAEMAVDDMAFETVQMVAEPNVIAQYPGLWFFLGALLALIVYVFIMWKRGEP